MIIPEKYLRFIWKHQLIMVNQLVTSSGDSIKITDHGELNQHEGPDFLNAKLRIGHQNVNGHIELHSRSSDWKKHRHNLNPKYQNVILHVVYEEDVKFPIHIPALELKSKISQSLISVIADVFETENNGSLPSVLHCGRSLDKCSENEKRHWIEKLGKKRFLRRVNFLTKKLIGENYDEAILMGIARALGYSQNIQPMQTLIKNLPLDYLKRFISYEENDRVQMMESILMVQSGLLVSDKTGLDKHSKAYLNQIRSLYEFSNIKRGVLLERSDWNFFRLRPANFPTLRLAALSRLLAKGITRSFLQNADEIVKIELHYQNMFEKLAKLFRVKAEGYWKWHYQFGKKTKTPIAVFVGEARAAAIVVNVLLPVLLRYYKQTHQYIYGKKIWQLYLSYPSMDRSREIKTITSQMFKHKNWGEKGLIEQGVIELKTMYCSPLNCLECTIGKKLIHY